MFLPYLLPSLESYHSKFKYEHLKKFEVVTIPVIQLTVFLSLRLGFWFNIAKEISFVHTCFSAQKTWAWLWGSRNASPIVDFLLTTFVVHFKGSVPRIGSSKNSEISLSTVVPNLFWLWYTYTCFQKYTPQSGAQWNENLSWANRT